MIKPDGEFNALLLMNFENKRRLDAAIEALRIIALSYRERIDRKDTPAYDYARQTLERIGEDPDL